MPDPSDTPFENNPDWQDRLEAAAATVTLGPHVTSSPLELEPFPRWLRFEGLFDVEDAEARFELARRGRELLPALAKWKAEVAESLAWADKQVAEHGFFDDVCRLIYDYMGVSALSEVLLEIGWVGGDNDSEKSGKPDSDLLWAYAAEAPTDFDRRVENA